MYQFSYNHWDENRFPGYTDNINDLYSKSISFYIKNDLEKKPDEDGLTKINQLFNYMEYYYAILLELGFINHTNFLNVLEQLKHIRLLRLMDPALRKRFNGLTHHNIIMMNPTPGCFNGLEQEESLQLATFHELGHIITSANTEDIEYLKQVIYKENEKLQKTYPDGMSYWKKGFELLDEVAVHNAAEAVLYEKLGRERPPITQQENKIIYPNGTFSSNFLEYKEFQELAYIFACCLEFIPHQKGDSMCDVLNHLSSAMFSRSFCTNMYIELTKNPSKGEDLIKMLMCMGKIKDAKYASFGLEGDADIEKDVTEYFNKFYSIAYKYRTQEKNKEKQKIQDQKIQG